MQKFLRCLITVALLASLTSLPVKQSPATHVAAVQTPKPAPSKVLAATGPAPVPTPPPVAPAPVYTAGCAQYLPLIQQYNWSVPTAMAIMQAESSDVAGACDPNAVSPLNYDGLRDYGLFQIHGEAIMSPEANVARAYGKYQSQGWYAWSTYNNGKYTKFLN